MKAIRILIITIITLSISWTATNAQIVVKETPVAPKAIEKPVKPDAKYVFVSGECKFNKTAKVYDWIKGHWFIPRPNTVWVPGYWSKVTDGYLWVYGQWKVIPKTN